ncbi:DUF302 domain-containing protein [Campylobacter sp. FMV-PI01]|uniref:DUF302 domain-containing protein n=1 Tax=Campylobacter portucalensis TaxID=2608384 RepID=A0A6L5WJ30_9BACT|nr:DUF302 domain-containing protein [Campylobacter portucalensis]MSN97034.1 DUF302 domain-containing protein [Campylobacter portucalensis]
MKKVIFTFLFSAISVFGAENILKEKKVNFSLDEATLKLENILKENNLTVFNVIKHSKLAKDVGLKMDGATVVIFGNPKAGTLLMQCDTRISLELPLKFLIYNKNNETFIAYEDIKNISKRYDLNNCDAVEKLSKAQDKIFNAIIK